MKSYRQFILMALATGICFSRSAAAENVVIFSFQDDSCGAWVRSQADQMARQVYLYWFRGVATGYNLGSKTKQVPLGAMPDDDTLALYIDKHCRDNPLSPFTGTAFVFVVKQSVPK